MIDTHTRSRPQLLALTALRALRSRVLETSSDGTQIMLSFRVKALACSALFPPRAVPGAGAGEEDKGAHGAEAAVQ